MEVFKDLFFIVIVYKSMNSYFITLVSTLLVFSSVYKNLANRLGKVLTSTVTSHWSAFVEGCQILDAALVANEVVEDVRSCKRKGVIFKLKVYGRVIWVFVDSFREKGL